MIDRSGKNVFRNEYRCTDGWSKNCAIHLLTFIYDDFSTYHPHSTQSEDLLKKKKRVVVCIDTWH